MQGVADCARENFERWRLVVDYRDIRVMIERARETATDVDAGRRPATHDVTYFAGQAHACADPVLPDYRPLAVPSHVHMNADRIDVIEILDSCRHLQHFLRRNSVLDDLCQVTHLHTGCEVGLQLQRSYVGLEP